MKGRGRYVSVKGDLASDGTAILIREITIELPEGVMHKLGGGDLLKLDLELIIDAEGRVHEQIVTR